MEDEREEELLTLSSIYPEINVDATNPHKFTLSVPVAPVNPITITFGKFKQVSIDSTIELPEETRTIKHLPPLTLTVLLPDRYPSDCFPHVEIDVVPAWLDFAKLKELEHECVKLWEDYGRCQILFSYIDYVQQAAERMFDLGTEIAISGKLKEALVAYDRAREKEIFDGGTYDCGVCLEPKKGSVCHRISGCAHVFCRSCLQDFYNSAISEGDVGSITCLDVTCGRGKPGEPKKRKALHPRELLSIGIPEANARRFIELKRKKKLEADKSTIFCPREWCQSAARSSKHPPIPDCLDEYVDSDISEDENADPPPAYTKNTPDKNLPAPSDRLAICSNPKCALAFCRVCYTGWHGEFARCWPRNPAELTEEEKASYDYIRLNTSPCPTCSSPTQKTMGCNHMKCFQCNTHFCYLCGAWLEPANPYQHFNNKANDCYMKLWELEEGDEGQGGAFEGARRWEAEARAIAAAADEEEDMVAANLAGLEIAPHNDLRHDEAPNGGLAARAPPVQPRDDRREDARVRPMPPPGPIDPMHAYALEVAARNVQVEVPEPQPLYAPNAYPNRDRPDGLNAGQRARRDHRAAGRAAGGVGNGQQQRRRRQRPAVPLDARDPARQDANRPRVNQRPAANAMDDWDARQQAAIRRFIEMAANDNEDEWDSDEMEENDFDHWDR